MFKRLIIGLLAASLLVAWVVPEADAAVRRSRKTVENWHTCNTSGDPCNGATFVTDSLYGYDGSTISCQMEGYLFCNPDVIQAGVCPVAANEPVGLTEISYTETATFVGQTAENLTVLDQGPGQEACNDEYGCVNDPDCTSADPVPLTTFEKFWPNRFVAHTIYIFDGGPRDGDPPYELIEDCVIDNFDPEYNCTSLWDSDSADPPPHLPCCGDSNTLNVQVAPVAGGTVVSNPAGIDCPGDCTEEYAGTAPAYDTCPEVVLTAVPFDDPSGSSYSFSGWIGGVCDGSINPICETTAEGSPTITANFQAFCHTLTVNIIGGDHNDRAWIFRPHDLTFTSPAGTDTCTTDDGSCTVRVCEDQLGLRITIKKQGDSINWGGDCSGVPNSRDQCTVEMTESRIVDVYFN